MFFRKTSLSLLNRAETGCISEKSWCSKLLLIPMSFLMSSFFSLKVNAVALHYYSGQQHLLFLKKMVKLRNENGYPYDNAPMERYFNTLKNECTNHYEFSTEEELYQKVEEFAYVIYNHVRPHSYNGYRTPYQARIAWQIKVGDSILPYWITYLFQIRDYRSCQGPNVALAMRSIICVYLARK